ncbi:NADAR family protein [Labrenzia sp. DG1229]|uniref:NADAR family protein n=1 Tax=Labrenzia sp. DG1229 TaxID=681847 RepID=UPI00068A66E8|nr:NADAR family protein [Labrenzia sp. DG1229]
MAKDSSEHKQNNLAAPGLVLDLASLQDRYRSGGPCSIKPFFGHTVTAGKQPGLQVFSQFFETDFTVNDIKYRWSEQFMMAGKARLFGDTDVLEKITESRRTARP